MKYLLTCLITCIAAFASAQTHLYVDSSVSASGSGTAWISAYKTLGEALNTANAASSGKYVINIAKGTYYPTGIQSSYDRDSSFVIARSGIWLVGGFPSRGGSRNTAANVTVLSGNIGTPAHDSDNIFHIVVIVNIPAGSDSIVLDGLVFTGGNADSTYTSRNYNGFSVNRSFGGGVHCAYVKCRILFSGCNFYRNNSSGLGGALHNDNSLATVISCSFSSNNVGATAVGNQGGAIYYNQNTTNAGPPMEILGCSFTGNTSSNSGGAIYYGNHASGGGLIKGCTFNNNSARYFGGALFTNRGVFSTGKGTKVDSCIFIANAVTSVLGRGGGAVADISNSAGANLFSNCSFISNIAAGDGGGFYGSVGYNYLDTAYIRRCSFTGNEAGRNGGGIFYDCRGGGFGAQIDSSIFAGNKADSAGGGLRVDAIAGWIGGGRIIRCSFIGDTARLGGGLSASGNLEAVNCRFSANKAVIGGGMHLDSGSYYLSLDSVQGNEASQHGGGIYVRSSVVPSYIVNCLLTGNKAGGNGGALYDSSSSSDIANCTFAGDTASNGNAIFNDASSPSITSCIIWDGPSGIANTALSVPVVSYSTVQGGYSGKAILATNPHFISPLSASAAPTDGGNYDISACSPAIDNGNPTVPWTSVDIAGRLRLFGAATDQGAYEYGSSGAVTGPSSLCLGSTAQYFATTSGGSWASMDTTIATINTAGLLTPRTAGIATITYVASGSAACLGPSYKIVSINPLPTLAPITALPRDSVCAAGGTITLSTNIYGGTWTSMDTTLVSISGNPMILTSKAAVGRDTLFYTVTNSFGCKATVTTVITVLPIPTVAEISGPDSICLKDGAVMLMDSTLGGTWFSSDQTIATIGNNGLFMPLSTGIVTALYRVTNAFGCSDSVQKVIRINQIDNSVTQIGHVMMSNQYGATSYTWLDCDNGFTPVVGATANIFAATSDGHYAVAVSAYGCVDTSACIPVTTTGITSSGITRRGFSLGPNPCDLTIQVISDEAGLLRIFDFSGRIVVTVNVKMPNVIASEPTGHLPAGLYQYHFGGINGFIRTGKLIVHH